MVPENEFTSVLFPFLVQEARGVEVADLDAITAAAGAHGALTLCDATQACGWLPLDAGRFDALVCTAYKWLMSPRGSAFMAVTPDLLARIRPDAAGWCAGEDVHASYFGPPLRLAHGSRRLDTSPAWFTWVGLEPSDSAIVSVDAPGAADRLTAAGIVAAVRGGRLRTSWHVYNTEADVDRVLEVLAD